VLVSDSKPLTGLRMRTESFAGSRAKILRSCITSAFLLMDGLVFKPSIDLLLFKPPLADELYRRYFIQLKPFVNSPPGDLQVNGQFLYCHQTAAYWHDLIIKNKTNFVKENLYIL